MESRLWLIVINSSEKSMGASMIESSCLSLEVWKTKRSRRELDRQRINTGDLARLCEDSAGISRRENSAEYLLWPVVLW